MHSQPNHPTPRSDDRSFPTLNASYNHVFQPNRLSVGLVVPLESYRGGPVPTMKRHLERAQLAESLGLSALWLRDVPFNVPSFGDAGQLFDPWVYLGFLAAQTQRIALGVASLILPLRHPAHVAKAAATVDQLSGGRLLLGIASGDRPVEYPAMDIPFDARGERFRASVDYIRQMGTDWPAFEGRFGRLSGIDMLPKPTAARIPLLITGGSQQHPDWIARNGDGWMTYPRPPAAQAKVIRDWRQRVQAAGRSPRPVMQPLYIDLLEDPDAPPAPIHLGFRAGSRFLRAYLANLEDIGINHVALNLRFSEGDVEQELRRLAEDVLPDRLNGRR
ncbi:MAG: LLM class oxidoreductase [Myxococcota bacterium]